MGTSTTLRQRATNSTEKEDLVKITSEGARMDKELDKHDTYVREPFPCFLRCLTAS